MISEDELYRKAESACRLKSPETFNLRSRIHRLRWLNRSNIWIKRDDELSFGVSGTRLRKHASIVPVYSAKLFITAKQMIQDLSIDGNILLIHSGGILALSGFIDYPISGTETSDDSY